MLSNIDRFLLSQEEQEELKKATLAYETAVATGDTAAQRAAHSQAEQIRARAGYSGGEDGSRYTLLKSADAPEGYDAYRQLAQQFARGELNAIQKGAELQLDALDQQKALLEQQGEQNQQAARSSAWNQQRLAQSGLLTRGLENTGLADVITATALNQAAANAYQALLDQQNDLAENQADRAAVQKDAMEQVADLHRELGLEMGDGFLKLQDAEDTMDLQKFKTAAAADAAAKDYYYKLALQQLKRQWELEDRARGL